ncbi:unnamed protein product, partial [Mesorhabditis spiculigera]
MRLLTLSILLPIALAQQPYGLSQLDNYGRLVNSGNLAGLGPLNEAIQSGRVRSLADLDGRSKLTGLPPLPKTDEEMKEDLSPRPVQVIPVTPRPTARPTPPTQPPAGFLPFGVSTNAELPPIPEEKQRGYYDDDGNFVPFGQKTGHKIHGARLHQPKRSAKRRDDIEDYMNDDYYDDPTLKLGANKKKEMTQVRTTITRVQPRPKPVSVQPAAMSREIPQVVQPVAPITSPPVPPTPPPPTFPPFVYRPKSKAFGRDPYFDNVLQEVEEYDDFLDQEREYRQAYPYAKAPTNPYYQLYPGQLLPPLFQRGVTIDNSGYVKALENHEFIGTFDGKTPVQMQVPQPATQPQYQPVQPPQTPVFTQPAQQQQPLQGMSLFPTQQNAVPTATNTATENPLLNLFKIFEFPRFHLKK